MLADGIWETLLQPNRIGIIMGCLIPISAILAGVWYKVSKLNSESDLKRSMIERGMPADEIERVLRASSSTEDD